MFHHFTEIDNIKDLPQKESKDLDFYMLVHDGNKKYINWKSDVNNVIKYTEFETTRDFKHIAMNVKHETKQEMIVYSSDFREESNTRSIMERVSVDIENESC